MEEKFSGEGKLLKMFIAEITRIPLLTKEEGYDLAVKARSGDKESVKKLVEANLRMVIAVAFKRWAPGLPLMDMISEGCLGLIRATKTFEPDQGNRFSTYAVPWIKCYIVRAAGNWRRNRHRSLEAPAYCDDGDDVSHKDLLVAETPKAEEEYFNSQIASWLDNLQPREREIIKLRFWNDLTLDDVGERVGLNMERVRQTELKALRTLRWQLRGPSESEIRGVR